MRYESAKTEKGNVGVSYDSQEAADLQAVAMDENGCRYCTDCTNTKGALRWNGEPAKNLLSLNGLRWPVSTDGKSIQIGCQHHSVDEWRAFDDRVIARMDSGALAFWTQHKKTVLGLAEVRRLMGE